MKKYSPSLIVLLCLIFFGSSRTQAQSKIILDKKSAGGFCNNFFDLGEFGFALVFNKDKISLAAPVPNSTLQNSIFYYSKDLSKRAHFTYSSHGDFAIRASKNHLYLIDRNVNTYQVKIMNYEGKELGSKKFDLEQIGLNRDLIQKIHFTTAGHMLFEVYDGQQDLHLYRINLMDPNENGLQEIDLALPSANPLEKLKNVSKWYLVNENMGYYILARRGANSSSNPNSLAYHIAFYDEDIQLFRELLLDNILLPGTQMLGKDASFCLIPELQSFAVSCLLNRNGKTQVMVANYGMSPGSSVMTLFWHKEMELQSGKHLLIEKDAQIAPDPPQIAPKGSKIIVGVGKGKSNEEEEILNQMLVFDAQGNLQFNEVQMGNYESLNLDGFCVDNDNLYSRIRKLQMANILKPYCEKSSCDVLDIDVDARGNELLILRDENPDKNQVIIYRFNAK